jgi:microcin C transport system permease protein
MSSSTPASNSTAWTANAAAGPPAAPVSPGRRIWLRFKRQRLGYWSMIIFVALFVVSLFAEVLANDRPLVVRYEGHYYFPILHNYSELTFGGDFPALTNYLDPYMRKRLETGDNFAVYPPNHYRYDTIDYFASKPYPAAPSAQNWLGTDQFGRDVLSRVLYGFRLSVLMALALTVFGVIVGTLIGAVQGFYGGRTDLIGQRLIEIWSSMPDLYLLIIFASIFEPSLVLLFILLSTFAPNSCATARSTMSRPRARWGCRIGRSSGATCCPTA